MPQEFISIQDAADLSRKSAQTIRRAIKADKLKVKKTKTPQGFNYLVNRESLFTLYKLEEPVAKKAKKKKSVSQSPSQKVEAETALSSSDLVEFHKTLQQLIQEHSNERQNYLRLIQALQDKIVGLENQFRLLESANQKRWFHFWK